MALVTKNDVTQIFAIQAPEVDLPPTFANYPRGWDTARSNNGKPTIKQFNYIQQRTDQNVLWIHQNGAALPYDAAMEYAENAHVVKDGVLQKKQGDSWVSATNKGYNLDYFVGGKSYPLHAEIMLTNGDIVKSTVANNIINPNVDMTGWVNFEKNQQEINENVANRIAAFVTPELFGGKADYYLSDGSINPSPTDNLLAFQKMENYLYSAGGGQVVFSNGAYYCNRFSNSSLPKSLMRNNVAESKIWYLAPNVRRYGAGTKIVMEGGSSSPYGWSTSANVLSVCDEEATQVDVSSVDQVNNSITVSSTLGFLVGDKVQIFRLGGNKEGTSIPNTPSRERAPCQILTIKSISGSVITFLEKFLHDFKTRDLLKLSKPNTGDYPSSHFDGFEFIASQTSTQSPYVLLSRQIESNIGQVTFGGGAHFSYGMGQNVNINRMSLENSSGTIESISNFKVSDFKAEAKDLVYNYPLLLNDNCVDFRIDKYFAAGYKSSIWCIFGVNGSFGEFTSNYCGTSESPSANGLAGFALTLGMPKVGFYSNAETVDTAAYKTKNLGRNKLSFDSLNILGFNKGCILAGDIDLKISKACIEYDPSGNLPIFLIGDSGTWLNDPTFYTKHSNSSIVIDKLEIKTKDGNPLTIDKIVGLQGGYGGLIGEDVATVTESTLSTDTALKLTSAKDFYQFYEVVFMRNGNSLTPISKTVSSITGDTLNLSSSIGRAVNVGEKVWTIGTQSSQNKLIVIKNITVNGVKMADIIIKPRQFVTVPANGTAKAYIKAQLGFYTDIVKIGFQNKTSAKLYRIDVENVSERKQVFSTFIGGSSGATNAGAEAISVVFAGTVDVNGNIEVTVSNTSTNQHRLLLY